MTLPSHSLSLNETDTELVTLSLSLSLSLKDCILTCCKALFFTVGKKANLNHNYRSPINIHEKVVC